MRMLAEPKLIPSFRKWLSEQPLDRQRAIRKAERKYVDTHNAGVADDPANRDFQESMEGYEDVPAGVRGTSALYPVLGPDPSPKNP